MASDQENLQLRVDMDVAGSLRSMQQFSAAYRQMLGGMGDTPEVAEQLKQLDAWDAKLKALQGTMTETAAAGDAAGGGLGKAGEGADKADKSIASVRTAAGALASDLGRITGVSPTAINALQSMVFVGFNPLTIAIAGVSAAVGFGIKLFGDYNRGLEETRRKAAEATAAIRDQTAALEALYAEQEKRKPQRFFSAEEALSTADIVAGSLVDPRQAQTIVSLSADVGASAEDRLAFAQGVRERKYTLDAQGWRRFQRDQKTGRSTGAATTLEQRISPTGRYRKEQADDIRKEYELSGDAEARLRATAKERGPETEAELQEYFDRKGRFAFSPEEEAGQVKSSLVREALLRSRTQLRVGKSETGMPFVYIENSIGMLNVRQEQRGKDGLGPRGGQTE